MKVYSRNTNDEHEITEILHDSFGWALTKDRALFESIFAKDDGFFTYYPDSESTVIGWNQFETFLDRWMDPRNRAIGFDIRNLRIVVSKTGEVAWFSATVDDEGEFNGEPWGAKTFDGRGFLRNAVGAGRYVNSICRKQTTGAQNNGRKNIRG